MNCALNMAVVVIGKDELDALLAVGKDGHISQMHSSKDTDASHRTGQRGRIVKLDAADHTCLVRFADGGEQWLVPQQFAKADEQNKEDGIKKFRAAGAFSPLRLRSTPAPLSLGRSDSAAAREQCMHPLCVCVSVFRWTPLVCC